MGFFAGNSLKTIRVSTGIVQTVAPSVSTMAGAAWNADNVIVFTGGPAVLASPLREWAGFSGHERDELLLAAVSGRRQTLPVRELRLREIRLGSLANEPPRMLMKFPVRPSSLAYVPDTCSRPGCHLIGTFFRRETPRALRKPIRCWTESLHAFRAGRHFPLPQGCSRVDLPGGTLPCSGWVEDGRIRRGGHTGEVCWLFARPTVAARWFHGGPTTAARICGFAIWLVGRSPLTFDGAAYTPRWSADGARIVLQDQGEPHRRSCSLRALRKRVWRGQSGPCPCRTSLRRGAETAIPLSAFAWIRKMGMISGWSDFGTCGRKRLSVNTSIQRVSG